MTTIVDPTTPVPFLLGGETAPIAATGTSWSPATGEALGTYGVARADAARAAVGAASEALAKGLPAHARADLLDRVADALMKRREQLASLMSAEVGKPIKLSLVELDRAVGTYRFSAAAARNLAGTAVPMDAAAAGTGKLGFTIPVPIGVVGAITPFNFPINLVAHKLGPALAAGCPVVLKPAPQAVLSALALGSVMQDCGLPAGWLSVLPGPAEAIGDVLLDDDRVKAITFTGSTRVGWMLRERAPRKKVLLELGGSAPAIVHADADIEGAATKLAAGAFAYSGQSCVSTQRIYVHRSVMDDFQAAFLAKTREQVVGDPRDPSVDVGPVIDEAAVQRLLSWIDEAVAGGATLLTGGSLVSRQTLAPTVLTDVPHDASLVQEEAFGPVVGLRAYDDVADAIEWANDTAFALQAAVFTRDLALALRASGELEFGGVLVNEAPTFRADHMPYGGTADSGNTREGPQYAVDELVEQRLLLLTP